MAISGGMKLFNKSQCLLADGASIVSIVSGDASADFAIDRNILTFYRSVASDDTTTETLEVTFPGSRTISRLLLVDHNFKDFNVKYDVAGVWTDFANVLGLDGSLASVIETTFADDTAYYEFTAVTTTKIQVNVLKTQVANAQKFISQIVVTDELGTFQGFPDFRPLFDNNSRDKRMLSGRFSVQKGLQTFRGKLRFKRYPPGSPFNADLDLAFTLFDRLSPFIIWPSGGRRGAAFFDFTLRGFRLKDIFTCHTRKDLKPMYRDNIYKNPVSLNLDISEVV